MKTVIILTFVSSAFAGPFSRIYHDMLGSSVSARGENIPPPEDYSQFPQYSPTGTGCYQSPDIFPTGTGYHPTGTGHFPTATGGVSYSSPYPVNPNPHKSASLSLAPSISPSPILPEKGPGYPTYPSHTPDLPVIPGPPESPCASSGFASPTAGWHKPSGGAGYPGHATGIHGGATTLKTHTRLIPMPTVQPDYPAYENEQTDGKGDKNGGGWGWIDAFGL